MEQDNGKVKQGRMEEAIANLTRGMDAFRSDVCKGQDELKRDMNARCDKLQATIEPIVKLVNRHEGMREDHCHQLYDNNNRSRIQTAEDELKIIESRVASNLMWIKIALIPILGLVVSQAIRWHFELRTLTTH